MQFSSPRPPPFKADYEAILPQNFEREKISKQLNCIALKSQKRTGAHNGGTIGKKPDMLVVSVSNTITNATDGVKCCTST